MASIFTKHDWQFIPGSDTDKVIIYSWNCYFFVLFNIEDRVCMSKMHYYDYIVFILFIYVFIKFEIKYTKCVGIMSRLV